MSHCIMLTMILSSALMMKMHKLYECVFLLQSHPQGMCHSVCVIAG